MTEKDVFAARQEGVAALLEKKGQKELAALVRKYGVVGAFDRAGRGSCDGHS